MKTMPFLRILVVFSVTGVVAFGAGTIFGFGLADEHSLARPIGAIALGTFRYAGSAYSSLVSPTSAKFQEPDASELQPAADQDAITYAVIDSTAEIDNCRTFPTTTPTVTLIDYLVQNGISPSLESRLDLAQTYGLASYDASAESNQELLELIQAKNSRTLNGRSGCSN